MYKKAAQLGLRFQYRGNLMVEDLFDLDLEGLNEMYKALRRERGDVEDGLLEEPTEQGEIVALKLAIVEDVFKTKQAEIEAHKTAAERRARKERIMEIIADKQVEELKDKSVEELLAEIEEL